MFPLFSRMLEENWTAVEPALRLSDKRAAQQPRSRLSRFGGLLGRSVGLWHGDVPDPYVAGSVPSRPMCS